MDYVRLVVLYIIKDGMDYGVDWQSYRTDYKGWYGLQQTGRAIDYKGCYGLCQTGRAKEQIIKDGMDYGRLVELYTSTDYIGWYG